MAKQATSVAAVSCSVSRHEVPAENAPKWRGVLLEMLEVIESRLRRSGLKEDQAKKLSEEVTAELSHWFSGRPIYLPRGDKFKLAVRDADIARRLRRGNAAELAEEYGIGVIQIYRIARQQRELRRKRLKPIVAGGSGNNDGGAR